MPKTSSQSFGAIAGIAVGVFVFVAIPLGVLIGCCGLWYRRRRGMRRENGSPKRKEEAVYEYPQAIQVNTAVMVNNNEAYEHVQNPNLDSGYYY